MVFNSVQYFLFLPTVLGVYWLLRRRQQNVLLLIASYIFYGWWDYRFLILMWISTLTDYTVGRLLGRTEDDRVRKRIFAVSLIVNLSLLGFFKYFNFFVNSGVDVLHAFGLRPDVPTLKILLPVGISFYTFHGISYTFDVFRRDLEPATSLVDFAVFIAFFPQLVAGPIGRAQIQLPQFENDRRRPTREDVRSSLFLILLGIFKKVAIADVLAPHVQQAFHHPGTAGVGQLFIGFYGFALQVYGDFSGYSDIARGSSRLFGIELLRNFEQPFLSTSTTEFWRTWHISLSTWLRDYVYIPLGGSRSSRRRIYVNTMILMLVSGLWHGAAWTFVAWGALQGAYLILERMWLRPARREQIDESTPIGGPMGTLPIDVRHETAAEESAVRTAGRVEAALRPTFGRRDILPALRTFTMFSFSMIFFRSESFTGAWRYLVGLFTLRPGPVDPNGVVLLVYAAVALFTIDILQRNSRDETVFLRWPSAARGLVYALMVIGVLVSSGTAPLPFVYFQF